jgi:hypothetical protein
MRIGIDRNRLQQVADYRMARKTLRTGAIGSIIMGAIALGVGALALDWVPAAIGVVLLATGLWNITRPGPVGIIIDGLTLVLVGLSNIVGSVMPGLEGEGVSSWWVKIGVVQLYLGGVGVMRFKEFRNALAFTPQDTELKALDDEIQAVEKVKIKESHDTIEFTTGHYKSLKLSFEQTKIWRARFDEQGALLVQMGQNQAVFAAKHEFNIDPGKKVMIGNSLNATFTIKGKNHKGTLSPQNLERYQTWKLGTHIPRAIAA